MELPRLYRPDSFLQPSKDIGASLNIKSFIAVEFLAASYPAKRDTKNESFRYIIDNSFSKLVFSMNIYTPIVFNKHLAHVKHFLSLYHQTNENRSGSFSLV